MLTRKFTQDHPKLLKVALLLNTRITRVSVVCPFFFFIFLFFFYKASAVSRRKMSTHEIAKTKISFSRVYFLPFRQTEVSLVV